RVPPRGRGRRRAARARQGARLCGRRFARDEPPRPRARDRLLAPRRREDPRKGSSVVRNIFLIAGRELRAYGRSPLGSVIVAGALLINGIVFYYYGLSQ